MEKCRGEKISWFSPCPWVWTKKHILSGKVNCHCGEFKKNNGPGCRKDRHFIHTRFKNNYRGCNFLF